MVSEHASPLAELGGVDAGGQNLHVARLSAALAAQGHEVRVYTRHAAPDQPPAVLTPDGFTVVHVPVGRPAPIGEDALLPYMRPFGRWLAAHWLRDRWLPDVIHAHFWMSGLAVMVAQVGVPRPMVQTFHALGIVERRYQREQDRSPGNRIVLEKTVAFHADRVVAQCRDEVSELRRLGLPGERVVAVPSGVDIEVFSPAGPVAPRHPDRPRILSVGRLVERKGYDLVIQALPRVPAAELVIVGGPPAERLDADPEVRRLRKVAADAGVADRVRLVGRVPHRELPGWYRSADVLACTPWYEPFGLTVLEGMACGTPVVATAVGGLTDTVVAGQTGDLVAAHDQAAIGEAVRGLLADRERRLAYAAAGVERARRLYPWSATAEQLALLYLAVRRRPDRLPATAA
jgi:glycosyltransferase involved in cell wall biosynthesis